MLSEKYRPKTWDDLVGQPKAVSKVRRIIEAPSFDRGAFWIEAAGDANSGIGKSSLAWLIAGYLASDFFVTHLDGSKCDKDGVREVERAVRVKTWSTDKPFKVWIVDEAHAMTNGAVDAWLTVLDPMPIHLGVVFTTTRRVDEGLFGTDCGPFGSRCHRVSLTNQGIAEPMAQRVVDIALTESLADPNVPRDDLVARALKLVRAKRNNMRATLMEVESGAMLEE